ncbi:hypothetical protein JZ751_029818 [Albula glossodonta]|uniref:Uncharacterized protein n=1 Tax=Albula glossodonta TaxID=121402 RepID=A0A8T2NDX2_9TELE|nr:hypothetical protein JZ751_029818 [Albula glossodonta]
MECPPSKRLKGLNYGAPCTSDPFGDDGDFTQDDLEEIDIMASQAYTGDVGVAASKDTLGTAMHLPGVQSKEGRKTFTLDGRSNPGNSNTGSTYQPPTVEASRKKQQFKSDRGDLSYGRLEAQQTELRKKLMEVEEKLLMKDGEIRVLRDSIRHAQQEQEHERQAQLVLEKERAQVQSLQSELHFKDAEMNEMKSKLQTSERGNKRIASSTARQSPRRCWPAGLAQDGCAAGGASSGAPPAVSPFLTKESFAAQLSRRPSPAKTDRVSLSSAEGRQLLNICVRACVRERQRERYCVSF